MCELGRGEGGELDEEEPSQIHSDPVPRVEKISRPPDNNEQWRLAGLKIETQQD